MGTRVLIAFFCSLCSLATACRQGTGTTKVDDKPAKATTPATVTANPKSPAPVTHTFRLPALKAGFKTAYATPNRGKAAPEKPPAGVFELVGYPAPLGKNAAYVTPIVKGKRRPAIVWIHGGFNFGISRNAWHTGPRSNDQSASALRDAGLVLMLPSLRGTNNNPGQNECFLGEVEDVVAAGKYLLTRPDVDPTRIYLGGHSTGGTMALLVAVSTNLFRSVFAFGPTLSVLHYGESSCVPKSASNLEVALRTPAVFFKDMKTPTFIIEGAKNGNGPYKVPAQFQGAAPLRTIIVPGADHFSVLRPGSEVVAAAILKDTGEKPGVRLTVDSIAARMKTVPWRLLPPRDR